MLRYVRITVAVTSLIACMLLIALWARSYWHYDWLGGVTLHLHKRNFSPMQGCLFESANGVLAVWYVGNLSESLSYICDVGTSPPEDNFRVTGDFGETAWDGFRANVHPNGTFRGSVPIWLPVILTGMLAAALGIRRPFHFSLRTLLIAMTIIAAWLGVIVAMV